MTGVYFPYIGVIVSRLNLGAGAFWESVKRR